MTGDSGRGSDGGNGLRLNWVAVPVVRWLGLTAYDLHRDLPQETSAASPARPHTVTQRATPGTSGKCRQYATARFGNLHAGTGLLLDMGRPATITAAWVTLGPAHGASFQMRAGAAPALADLPPVAQAASAASAASAVHLRLPTPAHGRYVLIWFTSLPPDPAGTFQASVYDVRLEGQA